MRTTGDTYISPIEIIDQYSVNKQGVDVGEKYRTGIYSTAKKHLDEAKDFIERREDKDKIVVKFCRCPIMSEVQRNISII